VRVTTAFKRLVRLDDVNVTAVQFLPAMVVVTEPSVPEPFSTEPAAGETSRDAATFHGADSPDAAGGGAHRADTPAQEH